MRVLLIGEYSNVHWTLAQALRKLGHSVTVVSSGDGWKNYNRDIDIQFKSSMQLYKFLIKSVVLGSFKGYDVVQLINFRFFFGEKNEGLNKYFFDYLKRYNKSIFLGAYGDDYFWVKACIENKYKYSPFQSLQSNDDKYAKSVLKLLSSSSEDANSYIADRSSGIISCMYEYYHAYQANYCDRLESIPLPVNTDEISYVPNTVVNGKIKLFIGVQHDRNTWKGTDFLLSAIKEFAAKNNDLIELQIASNVSYYAYLELYNQSNIFFDQLYSYSQGMNALAAMAKGKILFGGGEPESYNFVGEQSNFPIFNITKDKQKLFTSLEEIISRPEGFENLGQQSRKYIEKNHDYIKVAKQYLEVYEKHQ